MKKILILLIAFVLASCASMSVAKQGPQWERTSNATFHAGFYMICNEFDVDRGPDCMMLVTDGTQEEMDIFLKTLNEPPILAPEVEAIWFYWDIDNWLKVKPPFKYVP